MQIQLADAGLVQDIAKIHIEAWRGAYTGIIPQEILDNLFD